MNRFKRLLDTVLVLKRIIIFVSILIVGILLYQYLLHFTFIDRNLVLGILALWLVTAYLALPRLHRILTWIYLPNYYIGRSTTGEGILADPVNLAVIGSAKQLENAMLAAGWVEADKLTVRSTIKTMKATVLGQSYPSAPVSSLFLFDNKQMLAFQKALGGTSKRHHVRFWKTPKGWLLPGGFKCDFLGAATYDKGVGFSLFTFQVTHKLEADTDIERDFVVSSITKSNKQSSVKVVKNFSTGYHSKSGGGDTITTDGAMPFITLAKK
ncbi:MAG: LssY C-terminal domain-containing protein [Candidatus Saccharimonadales bacterium]